MTQKQTVRALRLRAALTQNELADLLGLSQTKISRLEADVATATRETMIALEVIFGASPRSLFPALYDTIESTVMTRAAKLDTKLRGKTDEASIKKLALLSAMVKRATSQSKPV